MQFTAALFLALATKFVFALPPGIAERGVTRNGLVYVEEIPPAEAVKRGVTRNGLVYAEEDDAPVEKSGA